MLVKALAKPLRVTAAIARTIEWLRPYAMPMIPMARYPRTIH